LASIFRESNYYLFHAYSLLNVYQILKGKKSGDKEEKTRKAMDFLLATLSIPLNNRLSNFERLAMHYVPQGIRD